jgi:hypothetical protein
MSSNQVREIKESIVKKVSFVFEKIFDEDQDPGLLKFRDAVKNFLDKDAFNSFSTSIAIKRYRDGIYWLLSVGQLKSFIEYYLTESDFSRYGDLSSDIREDLNNYKKEIFDLTDKLREAEKVIAEGKVIVIPPSPRSLDEGETLLPVDNKLSGAQVAGGVISALGAALVAIGLKVLQDKISESENKK